MISIEGLANQRPVLVSLKDSDEMGKGAKTNALFHWSSSQYRKTTTLERITFTNEREFQHTSSHTHTLAI